MLNPPLVNLVTPRLILRGLHPEEYQIRMQASESEKWSYFGFRNEEQAKLEEEKFKSGMHGYNRSFYHFYLIHRTSLNVIGACGFHYWFTRHHRAEIGYGIYDLSDRHQGYMSEALPPILQFGFEQLGLHRIEATLSPQNLPSLKLLQKNHFQEEGLLKGHYYNGSEFLDSLIMSLLRKDGDQEMTASSCA
ncbi:MAG: GNAT family N-acetyltransferase [Chitinophagaceae bacterium]|jgi:ribosomal-protein-alanine N-acetyltransferase